MAGSLTISTLSDGTNSTSTTNCIIGPAKAWVNFNGGGSSTTAGVINSSYNVSSITVNGTGDYTINFTNALPNSNYSFTAGSCGNASSSPFVIAEQHDSRIRSTTQLRIYSLNSTSGALANPRSISAAIFAN